MAFKLERFDIVKQNYDKTGLYLYHDTVGASGGADGDALATIIADDFFNPVVEELADLGGIIVITAVDGATVVKVTQLYDGDGEVEVKVEKIGATASITKAAAQADSTATDVATLKTDFNGLLAKLKTAGLMANA